ncbi:related to HYM1-component of the RAM signaling network [Sporisorium reilianum f. sp. reilianum]|uniref:Related to HYM1-component of the RAM signaling network n=1 Tax=Sporisorium reilianum f. sp. reilianum TaxID=72559 RepID=A0A2N8U9N8_9BASI|nr:related to HYM1-component of the RAM signaling network [Sporisorium reilianum f. sp. reilianum]
MNFIFKSKTRTPQELVRHLRDTILRLDSASPLGGSNSSNSLHNHYSAANGASTSSSSSGSSTSSSGITSSSSGGAGSSEARRKAVDEISKTLCHIKTMLFGEGDAEPQPELVAQLAQEVYAHDVLQLLVAHIAQFEFEAKKDVSQIFNVLLRRQIGSRSPTVEYLATRPDVIFLALRGYENADVALNTGMILREMLRHEPLAKILLYSDRFYTFPEYIETTTFGISCDAFSNFKETLTRHKAMVASYLESNYDRFFATYTTLLQSPNYVTKRQSLKLLGEILLDRTNFTVMTRYISSEDNLKMMMNLLRDRSKNIQFEAFHVFKVFVANPKKPAQIENILRRNSERLVKFLAEFHNDKDDEQFVDEKQYVLQIIEATGKSAVNGVGGGAGAGGGGAAIGAK